MARSNAALFSSSNLGAEALPHCRWLMHHHVFRGAQRLRRLASHAASASLDRAPSRKLFLGDVSVITPVDGAGSSDQRG